MRTLQVEAGKGMAAKSMAAAAAVSVALLLFTLLAGGCGGGREVQDSSGVEDKGRAPLQEQEQLSSEGGGETDADATGEEGPVTYRTGEGEVIYDVSQEPVPEEKLGVPVYPGASYVPGSGGTVSESSPEGECTVAGGQYNTGDDFETVFRWYRERLGEPLYADLNGGMATWNRMEEGKLITVGVRKETGHTSIMIYSLEGDPSLMNP